MKTPAGAPRAKQFVEKSMPMSDATRKTPYRDRQTWPVGVREIGGWNLKVYGICAERLSLTPSTIDAALAYASHHVPWPEAEAKFGFVIVHAGDEAVWMLVDLWVDDILYHYLHSAAKENATAFAAGPSNGTMACVWELKVMAHERSAWIQHVLSRPSNPDYSGYLRNTIEVAYPAV